MKSNDEVIQEFNDLVNMTAPELEKWLKSADSNSAGWPKDSEDGESVGHDSGRKIVEILKDNPQKNPEKYSDDQIDHMRKVVAYCKRHLAQESAANDEKSTEELKKTKSYASLKNWGHDILKKQNGKANGKADDSEEAGVGEKRSRQDGPTGDKKVRKTTRSSTAKDEKDDEKEDEEEEEEEEEEEDADDVEVVDVDDDDEDDEDDEAEDEDEDQEEDDEDGADEAGEERQTRSKTNSKKGQKNGKSKKSNNNKDVDDDDDDDGDEEKGDKKDNSSSKSKNGEPDAGDEVSWNWGQGQPKGKVLDVKHEKTSIKTKSGNEVSRDGSDKDPAVVLDTGKSKAIKLNHELN